MSEPVTRDPAFQEVAQRLSRASSILVFAGSGLSVESGVPTFRGEHGVYSDPAIARFTHVQTFHESRGEMMQWYDDRRRELTRIWPNPGHYALARLAHETTLNVVTQNVDGLLHQAREEEAADFDIVELHGALHQDQCHHCRHVFDPESDLVSGPICRVCKGPLRPAVTWFGEQLPTGAYARAIERASEADICVIVGTSGLVYPAAEIPDAARSSGAFMVEINPNESEHSDSVDVHLAISSAVALPMLMDLSQRL